jgi:hypothetical protein
VRIAWGSIERLGWLWRWRSETKDAELGESYSVKAPLKCGETRGVTLVCHPPTSDHLLFTLLYTDFHKFGAEEIGPILNHFDLRLFLCLIKQFG